MRPLPETRDALRWLAADGDARAVDDLDATVEQMAKLVPDLVAYSLALVKRSITLTYVRHESVARTRRQPEPAEQPDRPSGEVGLADPLDERHWQCAAQADAAAGILSTLSLPIVIDSVVLGNVTLYGSRGTTFAGRHRELAMVASAWAPGAVSNADLTFSTRAEATLAPGVISDEMTVDAAIAHLVTTRKVGRQVAEHKLREAAADAGIPVVWLALAVLEDDDEHRLPH